MLPVYTVKGQEGLMYDEFKNNLISICKEHQRKGRASAFALIMYNFHDPHIEKILFDKQYFNSLHNISGSALTIFCLFDKPLKESISKRKKTRISALSFDIKPVITDVDLTSKYNEIVTSFFGTSEFISPSVIFFQVDKDNIIDYFQIELKENLIEAGFNELKQIIENSVDAINQINPVNKENYKEIFEQLKLNVKGAKAWNKISKIVKKIPFTDLLSLFKSD